MSTITEKGRVIEATCEMIAEQKRIESSLGSKIDRLYLLKQRIANLNKQVKAEKYDFEALQAECVDDMNKTEQVIASGRTAKLKILETEVATVDPESWEYVQQYIKDNDAWQLLGRRVSTPATKELLSDGVEIPGLQLMTIIKPSLTLLK